jgi:hypothetical protein
MIQALERAPWIGVADLPATSAELPAGTSSRPGKKEMNECPFGKM